MTTPEMNPSEKLFIITQSQIDTSTFLCAEYGRAGVVPLRDMLEALPELSTQSAPNQWKDAVLDALATTCMDAPLTMPPSEILTKVIDWHVGLGNQPLQPITASDVTEEMIDAWRTCSYGLRDFEQEIAAAVNAWIKHRGVK